MYQQSKEQEDRHHSKMSAILIEQVIKNKQKEEKAKQVVHFWGVFIFVATAVFLFLNWYYHRSLELSLTNFLHSIRNIFSVIALSLIVLGMAKLNIARKDYEKAEEEFEQLREEIIDRQEQLWDTAERWDNRSIIFTQLDKEYGINLFHK